MADMMKTAAFYSMLIIGLNAAIALAVLSLN
ncbi:hypothetical protein MEG_01132 [Bartonella tamiae Th307]|uniref:Uncharacterized protein n=1 Tax=Bartonella tamiae Th239 TaxID=1094558 RepID=J0QWE1_9HYPH|nr:hypothetical protein ME5_00752 [Bartonella tamiae Th239]EJF93708.1 hypothetical protein MEG_01132 [Bartonella tamiae Th307]